MKRESSVSSPFMTGLREELIDLKAEVIKHYDAAMIGLADCSVTVGDHRFTLWLEFKLIIPTKAWSRERGPIDYVKIAKGKKGTQFATAKRLNALYIFWVNKSDHVTLWDARSESVIAIKDSTAEMIRYISKFVRMEVA